MAPAEAVAALSSETRTAYHLVGRLSGGETGAYEVLGPNGQRLVMKWDSSPRTSSLRSEAVGLAERMRAEARWPLPRQWTVDVDGCLFVVQAFMAGRVVTALTHRITDQLLALHEQRLGLAKPGDPSHWPGALLATLITGGEGHCRHDSLHGYDDRTAAVVEEIEECGRSLSDADLPGADLVHWDLHPGNMLGECGELTAIVDADFVVGDARFDLVSIALSSLTVPCESGVRTRLFAAAFDRLGTAQRQAFVSHLLLRNLDWSIRAHRFDEIEFWLARHAELLAT
jgi:hypothetical protein